MVLSWINSCHSLLIPTGFQESGDGDENQCWPWVLLPNYNKKPTQNNVSMQKQLGKEINSGGNPELKSQRSGHWFKPWAGWNSPVSKCLHDLPNTKATIRTQPGEITNMEQTAIHRKTQAQHTGFITPDRMASDLFTLPLLSSSALTPGSSAEHWSHHQRR